MTYKETIFLITFLMKGTCTNSDFFYYSLQTDVADLQYFKLWLLPDQLFSLKNNTTPSGSKI